MYANLVLSTFAEVQGDWFYYQDSFYFVQVCIPCLKFLLSSAYKFGVCF